MPSIVIKCRLVSVSEVLMNSLRVRRLSTLLLRAGEETCFHPGQSTSLPKCFIPLPHLNQRGSPCFYVGQVFTRCHSSACLYWSRCCVRPGEGGRAAQGGLALSGVAEVSEACEVHRACVARSQYISSIRKAFCSYP